MFAARLRRNHLHARLSDGLRERGYSAAEISADIRALIFGKKKPSLLTVETLAELDSEDKTLINFNFHDLRHVAISRLAEKFEMHQLMKVTGHKTARMVALYYHPRAEDLALKLA